MSEICAAWIRIVDWCAEHAPVTAAAIRPPATLADIRDAERRTGTTWPDQVVEWYLLADGVDPAYDGLLLPSMYPLPVARVVEQWEMLQDVASAFWNAEMLAAAAGPAGDGFWVSLPSFLPIAEDGSGDHLYVDVRPGPAHAIVRTFFHDGGGSGPEHWPSVAALLAEVGDALVTGSVVGGWRPGVVGGRVAWMPGGLLVAGA